jgi:hypothetical protein
MPFIEAPTTFYLGRRFDPSTNKLADDVVYYDSRDLTTHSVVVGMTGSGKTGLCISLLEEAALDNIPAIVIDPKGDITNLLLTFPDFRPEDFQPWVNVDDARRAGLDLPAYAADIAQRWKDGLQSWGIVPDRVRWLQKAAKYSIYTPGSDAGLPISILASLRAPREGWAGNEEANREKINGIVTALLALAGLSVEPIKDKEHVLVANIFENAWRQGQDLTLENIILQVQKPPFEKLGVFPIDQFMPEKQRAKLAMDLNNIIAAPSFQSWINGQPMDIQSLLYQPNGRPRMAIFYIAHLSEQERMFITTLILENMLGWMRTLSGTTSLRALLYVDEMFGYFPPYPRNPPTKDPLLRLLKQARAFGIGLVLATQNPGDLDYKGLSNAGTWFIGRLQSPQDKEKIVAGLQSLASAEDTLNLKEVEKLVSDIQPRVFLMRNIHDDSGPILVHTRWAMSYLRGPLTRQQVQVLMQTQRQQLMQQIAAAPAYAQAGVGGGAAAPLSYNVQAQAAAGAPNFPLPPMPGQTATGALPTTLPGEFSTQAAPPPPPPGFVPGGTQPTAPTLTGTSPVQKAPAAASNVQAPAGFNANPPPVASSTAQYFLPVNLTLQQAIGEWEKQTHIIAQGAANGTLAYKAVLLAQAAVRYQDKKTQIYTGFSYAFQIEDLQRAGIIHWEQHQVAPLDIHKIEHQPHGQAVYGDLAPGLSDAQRLKTLKGELTDMLYNTARLIVPYNATLGVYGTLDGDPSAFQAQVRQVAREQRDAELDKISAKYGKMMDTLEQKQRRKELELRGEKLELKDRKRQQLATTVESGLSLIKGNTKYTLSRMTGTARQTRRVQENLRESQDVLSDIDRQVEQLQQEYEQALQQINDKWAKAAAQNQDYTITPLKKDIGVELFGIGWIPYWYAVINQQPALIPAT